MSHFYSGIHGSRGPATRAGTQGSGISGYVQGWGARISAYMSHSDGKDSASMSLGPGPGSSGGTLHLSFPDADMVVKALDSNDPQVRRILAKIHAEVGKLNDIAEAAVERGDKRRAKQARQEKRERDARDKRLAEVRESITPEERQSYVKLMGYDADELRMYMSTDDKIDDNIMRMYGQIEPQRNDAGHLVIWQGNGFRHKVYDLTEGAIIEESDVAA
jgi:hypothetical protein